MITGFGQDSHRFVEEGNDKKLVLAGVELEHKGLKGNSDADVVLHSLFNAISQSIGEKSIGHYADPLCEKGIKDSREYLKLILRILDKKRFKISHIGISLECYTPKIEVISSKLKQSLANLINIKIEQIGINATSGEQLTEFGRGVGIQCFSVVNIEKKAKPFYKRPMFIIAILILLAYMIAISYFMEKIGTF